RGAAQRRAALALRARLRQPSCELLTCAPPPRRRRRALCAGTQTPDESKATAPVEKPQTAEITCVNKRDCHNPHERISTEVGVAGNPLKIPPARTSAVTS